MPRLDLVLDDYAGESDSSSARVKAADAHQKPEARQSGTRDETTERMVRGEARMFCLVLERGCVLRAPSLRSSDVYGVFRTGALLVLEIVFRWLCSG